MDGNLLDVKFSALLLLSVLQNIFDFIMAESTASSSLVSVNVPRTFPFFKCTFLDKDTGIDRIGFDFTGERERIFVIF